MGKLLAKFLPAASGSTFVQEVPSGMVNASNVTFTLTNTPVSAASLLVIQDGIVLKPTDWSLSGTTITMATAPALGQNLVAHYAK